jgi:hypothetical protein
VENGEKITAAPVLTRIRIAGPTPSPGELVGHPRVGRTRACACRLAPRHDPGRLGRRTFPRDIPIELGERGRVLCADVDVADADHLRHVLLGHGLSLSFGEHSECSHELTARLLQ